MRLMYILFAIILTLHIFLQFVFYICPYMWVSLLTNTLMGGIGKCFHECTCDEIFCWLRKEYSTRTWFRVYPNRIEVKYPKVRFFGCLGCGSWSADQITSHPFGKYMPI